MKNFSKNLFKKEAGFVLVLLVSFFCFFFCDLSLRHKKAREQHCFPVIFGSDPDKRQSAVLKRASPSFQFII